MKYLWLFLFAFQAFALDCQKMLDYVFENLPECGTLKQDKYGFTYVDIPDDYIYGLVPEGFEPPDYFGPELVGAHISVIYQPEAVEYNLVGKVKETPVSFTVTDCAIVHPDPDSELCILVVESPKLERIRKFYGLPKAKYPFHITIGVRKGEELVQKPSA